LLDALNHGFTSVEVDVFLVRDKLLVGHTFLELRPWRTLETLYLQPLLQLIREKGGLDWPLTLFVDIKSDGTASYRALKGLLVRYAEILSVVTSDRVQRRAVTVVVTGNRPYEVIAADPVRYVGIDGRVSDLGSAAPSHLIPFISDSWDSHFSWRGRGPMPEAERRKLEETVVAAHAKGRRVRFWGTPEVPTLWQELLAAGVDLIGTDNLEALERFLLSQEGCSGRRKEVLRCPVKANDIHGNDSRWSRAAPIGDLRLTSLIPAWTLLARRSRYMMRICLAARLSAAGDLRTHVRKGNTYAPGQPKVQ